MHTKCRERFCFWPLAGTEASKRRDPYAGTNQAAKNPRTATKKDSQIGTSKSPNQLARQAKLRPQSVPEKCAPVLVPTCLVVLTLGPESGHKARTPKRRPKCDFPQHPGQQILDYRFSKMVPFSRSSKTALDTRRVQVHSYQEATHKARVQDSEAASTPLVPKRDLEQSPNCRASLSQTQFCTHFPGSKQDPRQPGGGLKRLGTHM